MPYVEIFKEMAFKLQMIPASWSELDCQVNLTNQTSVIGDKVFEVTNTKLNDTKLIPVMTSTLQEYKSRYLS